jgi:hypothetical protein
MITKRRELPHGGNEKIEDGASFFSHLHCVSRILNFTETNVFVQVCG